MTPPVDTTAQAYCVRCTTTKISRYATLCDTCDDDGDDYTRGSFR